MQVSKMESAWLLLAFVAFATGERICRKCTCQNNIADCSGLGMDAIFKDAEWNETSTETSLAIIRFDLNNITHLTQFPSSNISKVSLVRNQIETIDDRCFIKLTNLSELDLSHNKLRRENFGPHVFMGRYSEESYHPLRALTILRLGSNNLHSLHPDLFEHLPNLMELYINDNPFTILDPTTVQSIVTPPFLKVLDMSYIGLEEIPNDMLWTPAHLEVLNLAGNRFTRPPKDLARAIHLKTLIMDNNPIKEISSSKPFPPMPSLLKLKMNRMSNLTKIEGEALGYLPKLEDLECKDNVQLKEISSQALSSIPEGEEVRIFSPIKRIDLSGNALGYLDGELLADWTKVEFIDLQKNPWVCDCNNQWLLETLTPLIERKHNESMVNFICGEPIEMRGRNISELAKIGYHMRCLDINGGHPEKDGSLLVGVLIITLLAVPLTLALVFLWRRFRYLFTRSNGPADYSRTFYSRADHNDDF